MNYIRKLHVLGIENASNQILLSDSNNYILTRFQIYDPYQTNTDRLYYAQNEISDVDENTVLSHGTTCPPNTSGQFPYAMDCRQFLNCYNGHGAIQSCAPGTLFNPRSLECDHPSKVKCKSFDEFSKPTGLQTAHYTSSHSIGSGDYSRTVAQSATGTYNNQYNRVQCQSGAYGLFAHPNDCTKFLNCNNGQTVIQDCGPGTAFNSITKVCDWPHNVDCGSRTLDGGDRGGGNTNHGDDGEFHHGEGMIDERFSDRPGSDYVHIDRTAGN